MDLIKVSQLDPSTEITENDLIMVVREINGTKYSFKTNVKSLLDKVNYDLATDVTGKPVLVGAQNTDYMPIIRKVGASITAYKITTEELVKLSKFDFPKTVNDSSSLSTLEDTDLIAIVRNETNGGTVRKITYKDFKDLVGKVKTVQGIEPDTAGNITLMNSKHYSGLNATLTIPVDLSKIAETFSVNITRSAVRTINIPKPDLTNVKEANIVNYTAYVVVKNTMVAVFNARFTFPNGSTVYFQGSLIDSSVALELPNRNILLCVKYGPGGEIYVVDHTKGMVDKVAGIDPDISGNVNPFIQTGVVSGSNTQLNIGNGGTASWFLSNTTATYNLWAPSGTDYIGSELYLVIDATGLASGSLNTTIVPGTISLYDNNGQRFKDLPNGRLTIQAPAGAITLYRFTFMGNQKVFFENVNTPAPLADMGSANYSTVAATKYTITAPCSYKESMMDAIVTVPDRWSNPESRYALSLFPWNDNNIASAPNGSTFIFSVTLDSAAVAGSDVMPISVVTSATLKLLDKTGTELDKAAAIKAYRGVKTWYKFTLYKGTGVVLEKMFISDQVTVNGAVADGNNDVKISKAATTLVATNGTSQTYKPNFVGLIDSLIVYPGQQALTVTVDLTFDGTNYPPTGWKLNILLDVLSGEDGGTLSNSSKATIKLKTKGDYIVNSSAALVKTSATEISTSWARKAYVDIEHLGNGLFKVTDTYPGSLYSAVSYLKPPCGALIETCTVAKISDTDYARKIVDLSNIAKAKGGFKLIITASTDVYLTGASFRSPVYGTFKNTEVKLLGDYIGTIPKVFEILKTNDNDILVTDITNNGETRRVDYSHNGTLTTIVPDFTVPKSLHVVYASKGTVMVDLTSSEYNGTISQVIQQMSGLPANWEQIIELQSSGLTPTATVQFQIPGPSILYFNGQAFGNNGNAAVVILERYITARPRRFRLTAKNGVYSVQTLDKIEYQASFAPASGGKLTYRLGFGADREKIYVTSDGGEMIADMSEYNPDRCMNNYEFEVMYNTNTGATLTFKGTVFYEGKVRDTNSLSISLPAGMHCFKLIPNLKGAAFLYKL